LTSPSTVAARTATAGPSPPTPRPLAGMALRANGLLGYVQGVGYAPESSQPVTASATADFGVGAFLLAGAELAKLG
jgi:hypothetical protein